MDKTLLEFEASWILKQATTLGMQVSQLDTFDSAERFIARWIHLNSGCPGFVTAAQMALRALRTARQAYVEATVGLLLAAPVRRPARGLG